MDKHTPSTSGQFPLEIPCRENVVLIELTVPFNFLDFSKNYSLLLFLTTAHGLILKYNKES